ncbi:alpha/beta fold hydrolase [Pararhizobium sp.]|uniref:alpha/beta fold hydrolase n=1 Tax=Pararhizobium sp. TaxID=1977563 RepID=UPI0027192AA2|nr:alpha/beta hydrolase [Pararhizobium sp.]MDO9415166.1 alpha/beta hydrolase [Pararhizobium sp.]
MLILVLCVSGLLVAGILFSRYESSKIIAANANRGELIDVGGFRMNSILVPSGANADLPPLVFVHGASGNLLDQMYAFRPALEGRAEMLFVDRPGHGYSERGGPENGFPDGQADAIAKLMDKRGIRKAIIIGHSFGGATVASFALNHKDKVAGLVFLSPATHPWPGGVEWYYSITRMPYIGWLFANLVAVPVGLSRIEAGTHYVFAPNHRPDGYIANTAPALVLRPSIFRNNAIDVANLLDYVTRVSPRYKEIKVPTEIITGDRDDVVLANIHSRGLARDIEGSELVWIKNLGHKPDYIVTDVAIAAIEKVAGMDRDVQAAARIAEARIAGDDEK